MEDFLINLVALVLHVLIVIVQIAAWFLFLAFDVWLTLTVLRAFGVAI